MNLTTAAGLRVVHFDLLKLSAEEKKREEQASNSLVSSLHLDPSLFAKTASKQDAPMS